MRIEGLKEIASQFDAMLIDQFGVIHNGQKLYPGAAHVLTQLNALKIPVIVMTNSGKRAAPNVERMVKMGIDRSHFVDCVSSGEVAFQSLDVKTAYLIGKRGEEYGFDPIRFVDDPALAEVMLILGSNAPETSLEEYRAQFASIEIPAICCNPDKLMLTSKGLQLASGAIADLYQSMGGEVTWIGKPYLGIYEHALKLLSHKVLPINRHSREGGNNSIIFNGIARSRVLCIGDSAEHDVGGGRSAGLSTLLVQQGISADVPEADIHPYPDYIMKSLVWENQMKPSPKSNNPSGLRPPPLAS